MKAFNRKRNKRTRQDLKYVKVMENILDYLSYYAYDCYHRRYILKSNFKKQNKIGFKYGMLRVESINDEIDSIIDENDKIIMPKMTKGLVRFLSRPIKKHIELGWNPNHYIDDVYLFEEPKAMVYNRYIVLKNNAVFDLKESRWIATKIFRKYINRCPYKTKNDTSFYIHGWYYKFKGIYE